MKRRYKILIAVCIIISIISIPIYRCKVLYDREDYCCRHMSRDLEDTLEGLGFNITLRRGRDGNNGHVWIVVGDLEIDSVSLIPYPISSRYYISNIDFDDYEDYQEWRAE